MAAKPIQKYLEVLILTDLTAWTLADWITALIAVINIDSTSSLQLTMWFDDLFENDIQLSIFQFEYCLH